MKVIFYCDFTILLVSHANTLVQCGDRLGDCGENKNVYLAAPWLQCISYGKSLELFGWVYRQTDVKLIWNCHGGQPLKQITIHTIVLKSSLDKHLKQPHVSNCPFWN